MGDDGDRRACPSPRPLRGKPRRGRSGGRPPGPARVRPPRAPFPKEKPAPEGGGGEAVGSPEGSEAKGPVAAAQAPPPAGGRTPALPSAARRRIAASVSTSRPRGALRGGRPAPGAAWPRECVQGGPPGLAGRLPHGKAHRKEAAQPARALGVFPGERRGAPPPGSLRKTPIRPAGRAQALAPASRASQGRGERGLNPRPPASSLLGPGAPCFSPRDTLELEGLRSGAPVPHRVHSPQQKRPCRGAMAQGPTTGSRCLPQPNPPGLQEWPPAPLPWPGLPATQQASESARVSPSTAGLVPTDPPCGFCCRGLPIGQQPRGCSPSHENPHPGR